jgi:hypothetical protein
VSPLSISIRSARYQNSNPPNGPKTLLGLIGHTG